jgi:copper-binding protein NosD
MTKSGCVPTRRLIGLLFVLVLFVVTARSFAAEKARGPRDISQGDVPLVISSAGAYRLVGNLTVIDSDTTAITVDADNVAIDLNGFTISGPGKSVGTGFGINSTVRDNVAVVNGAIRDFGSVGVHLPGTNNRVENVRVSRTGADGIFAGRSSVVTKCQVFDSASGINTDDGSLVVENTLYEIDNIAIFTSGDAPGPLGGVTVIRNTCRLSAIGIKVKGQGSRIEENLLTQNATGLDLSLGSSNFYARNVLHGNTTAFVGESDDTSGGSVDGALSNIILP